MVTNTDMSMDQVQETGDERAEIELRRRLVREAKERNIQRGGFGNLSPSELDEVIAPTDCWRTRQRPEMSNRGDEEKAR